MSTSKDLDGDHSIPSTTTTFPTRAETVTSQLSQSSSSSGHNPESTSDNNTRSSPKSYAYADKQYNNQETARRGSSISIDPSSVYHQLTSPSNASDFPRQEATPNNSSSKRQDMDRIKSRAADGLNWEAERDRFEQQSAFSSSSLDSKPTAFQNSAISNNLRGSLDGDRRYNHNTQYSSSSKMSSSSSSSNLQQNPVARQAPPRIDTRSNPNLNKNHKTNNSSVGHSYQSNSRQNSLDNGSQPIQSSYPRSGSSSGSPVGNGLPGSYAFGGISMIPSNSNSSGNQMPPPSSTKASGSSSASTSAGGGADSALATPGHANFPESASTSSPSKPKVSDSSSTAASTATTGNGAGTVTKKEGSGSSSRKRDQACAACQKPMTGQFVRALGAVYHLDCFRCKDCNKVVAGKFFPATDDMIDSSPSGSAISSSSADKDKERENGEKQLEKSSGGSGGSRLFPLCETDYFRRLDLLCAKCGGALRGSYITALGMKFHVEHFTCSICPTVFGPQDSYYEHDGRVFCHFHYSTRFAIRCTGCRTAILKQFVEINRNNKDEHWHPECYMIHKFWNIKLHPTGSTPKEGVGAEPTMAAETPEPSNSGVAPVTNASANDAPSAEALETEASETPSSLKQKQKQTEEQVYRIWTVLSAFEESSAACISEMLRHVSSGRYLNGVRMAERFILHVEILFASIDDLEAEFRKEGAKGISHIREARMLCKKIVNFFSLLSHTQETGARRMGITQELLSLVTGLAHYLKILIRIALTGALKLDREYGNRSAIGAFLTSLAALAREASNAIEDAASPASNSEHNHDANGGSHSTHHHHPIPAYGYQSLPRSTGSGSSSSTSQSTLVDDSSVSEIPVIGGESATDLCVSCGQTVEEECVRMGINLRWHTSCLKCTRCKRPAARDPNSTSKKSKASAPPVGETEDESIPPALPPARFSLEVTRRPQEPNSGSTISGHGSRHAQNIISPYCPDCVTAAAKVGFQTVTRLEQYAFLLRVALIRLLALLKKRGVVPASPPSQTSGLPSDSSQAPPQTSSIGQGRDKDLPQREDEEEQPMHEAYKDSQDIKRMKSVNLDRKLSTKARVPRISTVVGSPSGQVTHPGSGDYPTKASPTGTSANPSPGSDLKRSPRQIAGSSSPRQPSPADKDGRYASPVRRGSRDLSPNRAPQSSIHQQQMQRGPSPLPGEAGSIVPIRPAFARHNTDVRIRDDGPIRQLSNDDSPAGAAAQQLLEGEEGITLADIPQLLEAEQAREQHRSLPNEGSRCISELSALELFIVKHMAVMTLQQSALKDMVPLDDLIEFIETRKNTFWGKLFKAGKDDKKMKKKGVFGIPLDILIERNGADSTLGASATHLRVPSFIDDIISEMKQMDVSIEGIFRKNGNIRRLKDLSEALDRDPSAVNLGDDNPVQLAALLKKFLRELPDPLMTFKLHRLFVMSQKIEDEAERIRILHMVSILLPKGHRDTMEVLFVFLKWVASFSHIDEETGSKMDLQNLATVLAPNILYSKGSDPAKDETFLANRAVLCLLENQDDFWTVPAELAAVLYDRELLSSSAELTSRDILKRCEKYAKGHQRGGMKGAGRTQWASDSSYGEVSNRHRPDMQPPATMRYVENNNQNLHQQNYNGRSNYTKSPIETENRNAPWAQTQNSSPPSNHPNHSFNPNQGQQSGNASPHAQGFGNHFPPRGAPHGFNSGNHTPQRTATPNQDPHHHHQQQQQQQEQQQRSHHQLVEQRSN